MIGEPLRIIAGIALFLGTTRSNLIIISRRTNFIKNGWIFTGLLLIISGIIQLSVYGLDLFYELTIDGENSPIPINIAEGFSLLSLLFLAIFASIVAIYYPEAMLLSEVQIIKAAKLYDLISETDQPERELIPKLLFRSETPEVLIDYVKSLPEDIVESLDKAKSQENDE